MKIKYLTSEALSSFKSNSKSIEKEIERTHDKSWINTYLPRTPFKESKINVESLEFIVDQTKSIEENDFINARILFENLKHLNPTQAGEEALWTSIALNEGYDYMMYRWGFDNSTKFKYRWNFYVKGKRGYIHHGIARLWWLTRMSYDPNRDDPYELTRYAFLHQSYLMKLAYRNYSNSPKIVKAILESLMKAEENHTVTYLHTVELYKEVSLMGSASLIDAMYESELLDKISTITFSIINK